MYKVGLGDCFLLSLFNESDKAHHILIDFGVLLGTEDAKVKMKKVLENIKIETDNKIDTLVITHEHWDHLSGFSQAKDVFENMKIGELWLAWTENHENTLAQKLRKEREEKKKSLAIALNKIKAIQPEQYFTTDKERVAQVAYFEAMNEVFSFNGEIAADGRFTTAEIFDDVKKKAGLNIQYCKPSNDPFTIKDLEGIRVFVLGPPEDEKLIKKDLSKKEVYQKMHISEAGTGFFSANEFRSTGQQDSHQPFLNVKQEKYLKDEGSTTKNELLRRYLDSETWRKIDYDWLNYAGQLALALDSDTNNTSLVLAFELTDSGKFLLFPGDAQVGNWLSWHNYEWKVKNRCNELETINIKHILERTVFYKVGHHGSHNATLKEHGLEMMTNDELSAMIPVDREKAQEKDWDMPYPPLYTALKAKTRGRILMGDELFNENKKPSSLPVWQWETFKKQVSQDKAGLYVDLEIEC